MEDEDEDGDLPPLEGMEEQDEYDMPHPAPPTVQTARRGVPAQQPHRHTAPAPAKRPANPPAPAATRTAPPAPAAVPPAKKGSQTNPGNDFFGFGSSLTVKGIIQIHSILRAITKCCILVLLFLFVLAFSPRRYPHGCRRSAQERWPEIPGNDGKSGRQAHPA